jgi:hypothetical protein
MLAKQAKGPSSKACLSVAPSPLAQSMLIVGDIQGIARANLFENSLDMAVLFAVVDRHETTSDFARYYNQRYTSQLTPQLNADIKFQIEYCARRSGCGSFHLAALVPASRSPDV